jgi:hypothetical protein
VAVGLLGLVAALLPVAPLTMPFAAAHSVCDAIADGGTTQLVEVSSVYYCLHVFDEPGTHTFTMRDERITEVDYLVVGGGGGGAARDVGGGGGAGGLLTSLLDEAPGPVAVVKDDEFTVVVGNGSPGQMNPDSSTAVAPPGQESRFGEVIAFGGGGGANFGEQGLPGGSGGGSGRDKTSPGLADPQGQGSDGGGGSGPVTAGTATEGGGGGARSVAPYGRLPASAAIAQATAHEHR